MPRCTTRNSTLPSRRPAAGSKPASAGFLCLLFVAAASAQSVTVYSEFTRLDPRGHPVPADRAARPPREILSPAIPRNAFSSFQMVVEGQPGQGYTFQVVQNPEDAVKITAYRELYAKVGDEWVPDALEPGPIPS